MFYSKKLKKFKNIDHCFFSRKGGVSKGIYQSLNCGRGSKDSKESVNKNLAFVSKKMKLDRKKLILMHQTHSNKVEVVNHVKKKFKNIKSDAVITKLKGFGLGVFTADCVPIFLYDKRNQIIGAIHAGWKGSLMGIIENTVKKFKKINTNNKILATIGPCIGKKNYEVDLNFYKKFLKKSKKNFVYFSYKNKDKKFFDLRKYVNDRLIKLNVEVDHVNKDTFKDKSNFFSYRRSKKFKENDYGRCISIISLSKFRQD